MEKLDYGIVQPIDVKISFKNRCIRLRFSTTTSEKTLCVVLHVQEDAALKLARAVLEGARRVNVKRQLVRKPSLRIVKDDE